MEPIEEYLNDSYMRKVIKCLFRQLCSVIPGLNNRIVVCVDGGICSQINQYALWEDYSQKKDMMLLC